MSELRCTATTAAGRPCRKAAMRGTALCVAHTPVAPELRCEADAPYAGGRCRSAALTGRAHCSLHDPASIESRTFHRWLYEGADFDRDRAALDPLGCWPLPDPTPVGRVLRWMLTTDDVSPWHRARALGYGQEVLDAAELVAQRGAKMERDQQLAEAVAVGLLAGLAWAQEVEP